MLLAFLPVLLSLFFSFTAANSEEISVHTTANSMKIGAEFRSELIWNDHGLDSSASEGSSEASNISVTTAKFKISGRLPSTTEYALRFNLLGTDPKKGSLDYGYGTHWVTKFIGLSIGKMKVQQGGFDNIDENYRTHVKPAYRANLVYDDRYQPMIAIQINAAGRLIFQILDDKTASAADPNRWNKRQRQTWIISHRGEAGPIETLLGIGSYDSHHSFWIDLGLKAKVAGLVTTIDYWSNRESLEAVKVEDGSSQNLTQLSTSVSANISYVIDEIIKPWIHFSKFDRKQAETSNDVTIAAKNAGPNASSRLSSIDVQYNSSSDTIDDNASTIGIGADILALGSGWTPFLAIIGTSGDFLTEKSSQIEKRKSLQIKLGVLGEI